ncbi:MAG: hypothetical protein H0T66_18140 [Geodermatophilaceae bacterium]|nr:hypothetical protein [Geodermatophilaceae bacterium]MDQ3455126.1 hypothetical protein [Actinomycetota bacterium]
MAAALTRRRFLGCGGVLLVGACTGGTGPAAPTSSAPPPPPDPLLALLEEREGLLAAYEATGTAHPDLIGRVQPLQSQTAEHVTALRLALALPTATSTSSAGSSSTPASKGGSTSGPAVPADPAAALAELRSAVQASGSAAESVCVSTTAERAPLVGSLAAASACHALMLS